MQLGFAPVYDYTLGFTLGDPTSPAEQRLRDTATREELYAFLRALPASRFPVLAAEGPHAWAEDRQLCEVAAVQWEIADGLGFNNLPY